MKKIKLVLPILGLVLAVTAGVSATAIVKADENAEVIPQNVYIGDVSVGGMSESDAEAAVEAAVSAYEDATFELSAAENSVKASPSDLGLSWSNKDIVKETMNYTRTGNLLERYKAKKDLEKENKVFDIIYTVDTDTTKSFLENHAKELNQEAVNNGLTREDGEFKIIDGQEGIEVDEDASVESLQKYFTEEWKGGDATISLVANVVEPEGTAEELSKVKDLLGSFSTDFSDSSAGRVANVKNAVSKIDGTVLYPGEEFSVYEAIAPLDASGGYELAGAYENGTTVESYGGGVCQVSTTLYNAVIRAELDITERYAHSMLVTYVQPSMDAAIASNLKDLKFKNNQEAPIYIEGYCSGGIVYFNVFGQETRPADRQVNFVSETVSEEEPTIQVQTTEDPIGTVTVQKAHIGKSAKLWKIVTVDGVEESREVFNTSKYKATPRIISVGMGSDNEEAIGAMNAAIATQDEAIIRSAAATWCSDAVAARAAEAAAQQQQQAVSGGVEPPADAPAAPTTPTTPTAPTTPTTPTTPDTGTGDGAATTQ